MDYFVLLNTLYQSTADNGNDSSGGFVAFQRGCQAAATPLGRMHWYLFQTPRSRALKELVGICIELDRHGTQNLESYPPIRPTIVSAIITGVHIQGPADIGTNANFIKDAAVAKNEFQTRKSAIPS
jgi:hypothetical protein